jgi:hypothetical protein
MPIMIPAMAVVHEQVHQRAEQDHQVGQHAQQVGLVIFPKEEQGEGGEDQQHGPEAPGVVGWLCGVGDVWHVGLSWRLSGLAVAPLRTGAATARIQQGKPGYSL